MIRLPLEPSRLHAFLMVTTAAFVLAACAVGPKAPDASLPPLASGAFTSSAAGTTVHAPRDDWWRLYADPVLDRLVLRAFANNNSLAEAESNLRAVRATLGESRAGLWPSTTVSGTGQYGRASAATVGGNGGQPLDEGETYDVGLDVGWEVDLFGRVGSSIRAATADVDAAAAALDAARISVAAETARAYSDICAANAQIAVAERTLLLQTETMDLTRRLLDAGSGTGLDIARAGASAAQTAAAVPPLRAQRDAAIFRLTTLTGVTPAEVDADVRDCAVVPALAQPIPIGDGALLLARRPDVRQAERRLAAAAARVNVATASLYPGISLGGSFGSTALDAAGLGDDASLRFSAGP